MRRLAAPPAARLFLLALSAPPAAAQEPTARITGVVRSAPDSAPVPLASIVLTGTDDREAAVDSAGHFRFERLYAGRYIVTARAIGYEPYRAVVQLADSSSLELAINLLPEVAQLTELVARGTRSDLTGFLDRRQRNAGGYFGTAEEFRRTGVVYLCEALRRFPAFRVTTEGASRCRVRVRRSEGASVQSLQDGCTPVFYVNGARGSIDQLEGNQIVMDQVAALEAYAGPAGMPMEFSAGAACGAILVWLR